MQACLAHDSLIIERGKTTGESILEPQYFPSRTQKPHFGREDSKVNVFEGREITNLSKYFWSNV